MPTIDDHKPDPSAAGPPPERIAERFVLEKLLGIGASGAVYRAFDEQRGETIAIKFLTDLEPDALFRFKSEFRTLANLSHPNLLQLHELLSHERDWLLTMELIDGCNFLEYVRPKAPPAPPDDQQLTEASDPPRTSANGTQPTEARDQQPMEADELPTEVADPDTLPHPVARPASSRSQPMAADTRRRALLQPAPAPRLPLDEPRLRQAFLQLCEGLQALHRAGRLHRDLKPANVLVSSGDGRVVICDFGLALVATRERSAGALAEQPANVNTFEVVREIAGTPAFMSPEQAQAGPLTAASDWYSVGVMLYLALTGRAPFGTATHSRSQLALKRSLRPPDPLQLAADLPIDLAKLALALLDPDPRGRAGYAEAVAAFERGVTRDDTRGELRRAFVGREPQLAQLNQAFASSRGGAANLVLVAGTSGMGKSALVQHFLSRLEHDADALVLRARCYEREQLPFKALDPLLDALSSHLLTLPLERLNALLPPTIGFLAAMFPALSRVRAVAARTATDVTDPRERRRLAFRAFRELCRSLAQQRPLVLFIDDLQWGDLDSAPVFQELLRAPNAPPVLLVCAYRREDERHSPLVSLLRGTQAQETQAVPIEVSVGALEQSAAARLARGLLSDKPGSEEAAERIAREAEGSPFFVGELAAYVMEHGAQAAGGRIRLDALIREKLERLQSDSREVLTLIALAGRPLAHGTLRAASGFGPATFKALRDLESRRLVVSTREGAEDRVECYHDRIREAACEALSEDRARSLHRALAEVLETAPVEDCDALLEHWRGAGDRSKACRYALLGAERAETALAFTRAADLYRQALALLPEADPRKPQIEERLGHALILAGRGVEAASVFTELIAGAAPARALGFRMLATTQLLRGGKLTEGFHELERADDLFGVRFPRSESRALAMLLSRELRIRLRERRFVMHPSDRADAEKTQRLEALWEVAAAVTNADFLRGGVYGAELMLRAMELGDPSHIAGACGLQAVVAGAANKPARAQRMIDLATRASEAAGGLALAGRIKGMTAVCRQLQGRWLESVKVARESQDLQQRGARLTWDHAIMIWWEMQSSSQAGLITEVVQRVPEALRDAETRGDVYAATSFRTHRSSWAWLGIDRPDVADRHVDIAEREWTPNGYQFQHWHMTYARSEVDLYRRTPERTFRRVNREWNRARLTRQVQGVRVDMLYTRARLALAMALIDRRASLLALARRDGLTLVAEKVPWSAALGELVLAAVDSFESRAEAQRRLSRAEAMFRAADMLLQVEVCRARSAQLAAGSEAASEADAAYDAMRKLGVARPEGFLDLLLPMQLSRGRSRFEWLRSKLRRR
jgi:serine/threonine protein kinase